MSAVGWLIKCGAGAAIVLIACGFATVRFGSGLQMPATTTRDGTLITLSRYLREPVPDIVLVGSSITFRLKELNATWKAIHDAETPASAA